MNDISVLDRAMQTVKKDMAGTVADGDAASWVQALQPAVEAHNERPHSTTYVAPSAVEKRPQLILGFFKTMQENILSTAIDSNERKWHYRKLAHFGLQPQTQEVLNHNMGMYRCLGAGAQAIHQIRSGTQAKASTF